MHTLSNTDVALKYNEGPTNRQNILEDTYWGWYEAWNIEAYKKKYSHSLFSQTKPQFFMIFIYLFLSENDRTFPTDNHHTDVQILGQFMPLRVILK